MSVAPVADNPYLSAPYGPIAAERVARDLPVQGEIPRELLGVYARNGSNPRFQPPGPYHWFDGDGMIHAVHLEDGRATYRNRYVRTAAFERETEAGHAIWRGLLESVRDNPRGAPYKDTANTDLVFHDGRLIALWYIAGVPYALDPLTLETQGPCEFVADRRLSVSAHAKVDPVSGELLFFDYGPRPPWMSYGVVDASGALSHLTTIDLPGPRLPHDMAITERYSVLMDLPVYHRPEALKAGRWLIDYHADQPARFGVLPRHADGGEIRWFEAQPCYIYHVVNAWEEGSEIVMLACRTTDPLPPADPSDGPLARMMANLRLKAQLHRYRFDLATGQTREEVVCERFTEFPCIDQGRLGRRSQRSWHASVSDDRTLRFDGLVGYDLESGASESLAFGDGRFGSEAVFVPREGAVSEDEGWLLSYVTDVREGSGELWIIDAAELEAGPVARVGLPHPVPAGFHACWAPGIVENPA